VDRSCLVKPLWPILLIQNAIISVLMFGFSCRVAKATKDRKVKVVVADGKAISGPFIPACFTSREHLSGYKGGSGVRVRS